MNDIRERFEEIWPVPEGVYWNEVLGIYAGRNDGAWFRAECHDLRLDTFTRCQETFTASLPDRMEMQPYQTVDRGSTNYKAGFNACLKQIMEQKK